MEFYEWIYTKYWEWRGRHRASASLFAAYIGVSQPTVTGWINRNKGIPTTYQVIIKLARRYPDVYSALGLPHPYPDDNMAQLARVWPELSDAAKAEIMRIAAG